MRSGIAFFVLSAVSLTLCHMDVVTASNPVDAYLARALVACSRAKQGEAQVQEEFQLLDQQKYDDPDLQKRHAAILRSLRGVVTPESYAARMAPLLRGEFEPQEARRLATALEDPLVRRWFATIENSGPRLAQEEQRWRDELSEKYLDLFIDSE